MKTWRTFITALTACAGLAPAVWAQVPPPPPAVVVAPAPAPAPVVTVWAKLGITPEGCARCKEKFCTSPLGQLINNGLKPVSAISGGIIGNCCPADLPKPSDLAKPPTSSEGAAAQIKKDEADAKARAAAV